jgi:hypothetical protein
MEPNTLHLSTAWFEEEDFGTQFHRFLSNSSESDGEY